MALSYRMVDPRLGGPQLGQFQARGAYGGGAPSVAQVPGGKGQQAEQINPMAVSGLLAALREKEDAGAQAGAQAANPLGRSTLPDTRAFVAGAVPGPFGNIAENLAANGGLAGVPQGIGIGQYGPSILGQGAVPGAGAGAALPGAGPLPGMGAAGGSQSMIPGMTPGAVPGMPGGAGGLDVLSQPLLSFLGM